MDFIPFYDVMVSGKKGCSQDDRCGQDQSVGWVAVEVWQTDATCANGWGDGSKFHRGRNICGDPSVEVGQEV